MKDCFLLVVNMKKKYISHVLVLLVYVILAGGSINSRRIIGGCFGSSGCGDAPGGYGDSPHLRRLYKARERAEEEAKRKKEAEDKKRREEAEAKKRAAEEEAKRKNEAEEAKRKEKERKDNDALDDANDLLKGFNGNNGTNKTNKPNDAQQKNNQTFFGNTPDLPLPPSSSPYPGGSNYNSSPYPGGSDYNPGL